MSATDLTFVAICGSLRHGSYNAAAMRHAMGCAPDGVRFEPAEIGDFPLYNEDVRTEGMPAPVERVRAQIKAADGLLIVTPEYNYSVPGVLKNAIDWISRPPEQPFDGKTLGIMGCSPGAIGTARCQYHLRQCFIFLNAFVMSRPEVMVGGAAQKFDQAGALTDEPTAKHIQAFVEALVAWTRRLKGTAVAG